MKNTIIQTTFLYSILFIIFPNTQIQAFSYVTVTKVYLVTGVTATLNC